ncbi:MAG: hypothetical protein ING19_18930 [Azospirillum sp.]|nr:hypothetical protein [Azospirillum sp.]
MPPENAHSTLKLDLTDTGIASWKLGHPIDLRRSLEDMARRESWTRLPEVREFEAELSIIGRELQAAVDMSPDILRELFAHSDFVDNFRILLAYSPAATRAYLLYWLIENGGSSIDAVLALPPVDSVPEPDWLDSQTPLKIHEIVLFFKNFMRQLYRRRIAARVFSPERVAFLSSKIDVFAVQSGDTA